MIEKIMSLFGGPNKVQAEYTALLRKRLEEKTEEAEMWRKKYHKANSRIGGMIGSSIRYRKVRYASKN